MCEAGHLIHFREEFRVYSNPGWYCSIKSEGAVLRGSMLLAAKIE